MKLNTDAPSLGPSPGLPENWPSEFVSGDAARFKARYRVASEFKKAEFSDEIEPPTARGYSDLLHYFLTYSAWDQFQSAFTREAVNALPSKHPCPALERFIQKECEKRRKQRAAAAEPPDSLFDHLLRKVEPGKKIRRQLEEMAAGKSFDMLVLAAGTRNAFFHGELTPNASGGGVTELVRLLTEHLLLMMRKEAGALARQLLSKKLGSGCG